MNDVIIAKLALENIIKNGVPEKIEHEFEMNLIEDCRDYLSEFINDFYK